MVDLRVLVLETNDDTLHPSKPVSNMTVLWDTKIDPEGNIYDVDTGDVNRPGIQDMSIADVRAAAKANEPGFKTNLKALDGRKVQQAMTMLETLLELCNELNKRRASYRLSVDRPEAIRVTVDVPRAFWEFDFFPDGEIELERHIGQGVVDAGPADLEAALRHYDPD